MNFVKKMSIYKSRFFNFFLYFFLTTFFFTVDAFSEIVWQLPAQQRAASGEDTSPVIVATDDTGGNVAMIWRNSTDAKIQVVISNNFGSTWSSPIDLSVTPTAQNSDIAISSSGQYIYGIWEARPAAIFQIEFSRSTDFGSNWTPTGSVAVLSDTATNAARSHVATNSSGSNVYALWRQTVGAKTQIQTSRSTDFGATWPAGTASIKLSEASENAQLSQIVTNNSGQYVYAVWRRQDGGIFRVQTSRSIDFGASWTPIASVNTISANDNNATDPQIATSFSGQFVYGVWEKTVDGSNTNIQFSRSTDFGATFSTAINVVSSIGQARDPKIAIDATGQYVYLVYSVGNSTIRVSRSTDFGATFSDPITISTGSSNTMFEITANVSGQKIFVIWTNSDSLFSKFVGSSFDFGETFSDPVLLSGAADSFTQPAIITDNSVRFVYSAFDLDDGSNIIIFSVNGVDQTILRVPIAHITR